MPYFQPVANGRYGPYPDIRRRHWHRRADVTAPALISPACTRDHRTARRLHRQAPPGRARGVIEPDLEAVRTLIRWRVRFGRYRHYRYLYLQ